MKLNLYFFFSVYCIKYEMTIYDLVTLKKYNYNFVLSFVLILFLLMEIRAIYMFGFNINHFIFKLLIS